MSSLRVRDFMWTTPAMVLPDATLQAAAARMAEADCGVLPVGTPSRIDGIITDRDIVLRAVAPGKDPKSESVADCMTEPVHVCMEDDSIDDALEIMKKNNVNRLAVLNPAERLSGVLSLEYILRNRLSATELSGLIARADQGAPQQRASAR